jgi:hypothetical protein
MANNLWTAFIADNGSNDILAASLPEGGTWTPSVPINQTSPFAPSLALFEGVLYCAFITDDVNSATGVPSNRIFLCWTTDGVSWSDASFFNQHSKCAPSLAVWLGKLHIAFVANNSSNTLLVYFSATPQDAQSWGATVAANHSSANAPALAAYQPAGAPSQLYMAFVADNGSSNILLCSIAPGGQWTRATATGKSCHFSPSLAVLGDTLYLVFAAANTSKDLLLSGMEADGSWSSSVPMNQSSSATPCAVGFGPDLSAAFVANNSSGEVLQVSASNPASSTGWTGGNVDLKQQSAAGPAIAAAPFACCWQLVEFQGRLGGSSQYVFWAGLGSNNKPIPVLDLVVEITIDEAIVVSPTSGFTRPPPPPYPLPIGFQINGFPTIADQQPGDPTSGWSPTAGDLAIGWQQFGVNMWPNRAWLKSWVQYWPPAVTTNSRVPDTFNLAIPDQYAATLPNNLTIPAGWTIRFVFDYSQTSPGTITGFACTVTDGSGARVPSDMDINFLDPPPGNPNTPIGLGNLAQLAAFQVMIVGFFEGANATLLSGGGTITVQSSTPLTVQTKGPPDCDTWGRRFGTGEDANSTYGLLPSCPSKSFTQAFGVL